MKALVKPNMHIRLASGGLTKHLHSSITPILGVENDRVEWHPPIHNTRRT